MLAACCSTKVKRCVDFSAFHGEEEVKEAHLGLLRVAQGVLHILPLELALLQAWVAKVEVHLGLQLVRALQ